MRRCGLRGASFVKSFPITFLCIFQANVKGDNRNSPPQDTARGTRKALHPRISKAMAQQKEIISTINSLIETLKDGQEGFRQASEAVKDSQLKMLFNEYSLQRSKFAGELQSEAIQLGEDQPEDSSSTAGAMHRAWINLKGAITKHDDHAILEECERGEDSAVNEYQKAIEDEEMSAPVRDII